MSLPNESSHKTSVIARKMVALIEEAEADVEFLLREKPKWRKVLQGICFKTGTSLTTLKRLKNLTLIHATACIGDKLVILS